MNSKAETPSSSTPQSASILSHILWALWPVYKEERAKIIPMTAVFFFVSFIYNILGALKKTILLTTPAIKAQAVSYLKIFAIMPAAIGFTLLTAFLQARYGQKRALQSMIVFFGLSFALITLVVFPNRESLLFAFSGDFELINLINNWDVTMFYIFSEMWSSIILNVLCWGIIIETTHFDQSKRIYAIFTAAANLATLVAGFWAAQLLDNQLEWLFQASVAELSWFTRLFFQMGVVWVLQGVIIILLNYADTTPTEEGKVKLQNKQNKPQVSLIQAIKISWQNPILRSLAVIMVTYNMIYHLSDVTHSAYVKSTLSQHSDLMNKYFNYVNLYLGVFAVAFSWFLSGFFIRRFGLKISLLVTPIVWALLSVLDLVATFSNQTGYAWHGMQVPLNLVSLSILLSVGRAIKFTLFDTSQQMSFLSLDHEKKRLGKAAIDGLSSRFGKSGGAWLLIMITSQFGGQVIASILPIKAVIFSCYLLWFYATFTLIKALPNEDSERQKPRSSEKAIQSPLPA